MGAQGTMPWSVPVNITLLHVRMRLPVHNVLQRKEWRRGGVSEPPLGDEVQVTATGRHSARCWHTVEQCRWYGIRVLVPLSRGV